MILDGKKITSCLLYYTIFIVGLSYCRFITMPSFLFLGSDIFLILLLMIIFKTIHNGLVFENRDIMKLCCVCLLIAVYCLISGLMNLVPIAYIFKAARSFLRGLILIIGIALYFDKSDVHLFFDRMEKLFVINMIFVVLQKIFYSSQADNIIGFCGTFLTLFMSLMQTYAIMMYIKKQKTLGYVAVVTICNFLIAIWGDQRIFYFMFIAVAVVIILAERISLKTVGVAIGMTVAIVIGLYGLSKLAPESYKTIIDMDAVLEYGNLTSGGYEISRFGAFDEINDLFFNDNLLLNLFGYGFGIAEIGTPFNFQYGNLHYMWFMHEWTFLELGYIGIALFVMLYIGLYFFGRKYTEIVDNDREKCMIISCSAISIISLLTMIYYNVHRGYASIFMYGAIGMMLAVVKEERY